GRDVPVAGVERAGVLELELAIGPRARAVLVDQARVRVLVVRVLVERLQVRARRRGVEVIVQLLAVLTVVALGPGQPEQPLLEDRVAAVPQREREAQPALAVADAEQAILAPAVDAAARVVVRKVRPAFAGRVVLAHGAPLALRQVRAPAPPVVYAPCVLGQSLTLGVVPRSGHGAGTYRTAGVHRLRGSAKPRARVVV